MRPTAKKNVGKLNSLNLVFFRIFLSCVSLIYCTANSTVY